jgi:hypothetical protein
MIIKTDAPTVEKFARLVRTLDEKKAQHIIDAGTHFVCGYDDDGRLIGLIQYAGNGITWILIRIDVIQGKLREGIGTELRMALFEHLETVTMGTGSSNGWFERGKAKFWNSIPGTRVNPMLAVASRQIDGKL